MKFLLFLFIALFLVEKAEAQPCYPVPHGVSDQWVLNQFWQTNVRLCRLPPSDNRHAFAVSETKTVWIDQDWGDRIAYQYGSWATTGILAHEWGHIIQGSVSGTGAELQADCLAGVFMRAMGLHPSTIEQYAVLSWYEGGGPGHGTGEQRLNAALIGYHGYSGQRGLALQGLCPLSAF